MYRSFVLLCVHARAPQSETNPSGFYHTGEDDKENEGKRTYYRVISFDCSSDDVMDKLRDMFDKVFHQMATRVVVEAPFEEGSQVAETVSSLRELAFLHFTK